MKGVTFGVQGSMAHFRRPDTTATHLSYPFITPTAAKGLVGAILGIENFVTKDYIGIEIKKPVRTVAQQLSFLGKDGASALNRPTTVELIVAPEYRIFYAGEEYTDSLIEKLQQQHAVYPTFLGCGYAITKPVLDKVFDDVSFVRANEEVESCTVVPTDIIGRLGITKERQYGRAGGVMLYYRGERTFEQSVNYIYEQMGRSIVFTPKDHWDRNFLIARFGEDVACLV